MQLETSTSQVAPIGSFEPLLSVEDVAKIVGRSHWTLRRDLKQGRIQFVRVGRSLMISPDEVRRIIREGL